MYCQIFLLFAIINIFSMKTTFEKTKPHLFEVKTNNKELKVIPFSDVHFDSKKCDRAMLKKHLDMLEKEDAYCWFNGDFFDVMGCNRDPRSGKEDIRPEYNVKNYLDAVIVDAEKFLRPYKDRILFMSDGNHETNILNRQETNVLDRLCAMLGVERMGYSGFIRVNLAKVKYSKLIHFHHGFGGNAPRSKGIMRVDIDAAKYPDADVIVRGHTHQKWAIPSLSRRLTSRGEFIKKTQYHFQLGSYKDGYGKGIRGWEVEKEFSDTPLGSFLLNLSYQKIEYQELI
jgi:hypothetical protein